ncbi:MAG: ferrous iron transport protein B [Spirochaetia bacterium]|nr:ferrous iron transport protein B [Spirochaetia bacterium]
MEKENKIVYLVGNANVGKSVIFSALTRKYAAVSNYPGTTVEITEGELFNGSLQKTNVKIIDTPGINSLAPLSEDERVTRDILLKHEIERKEKPEVILVIDAKNLRRGLVIACQLIYAEIPFIIVLNMMDEAVASGIKIDIKELERRTKVPVIPAVAVQKEGISKIINYAAKPIIASKYNLISHAEVIDYSEFIKKKGISFLAGISLAETDKSVLGFMEDKKIKDVENFLLKKNGFIKEIHKLWFENVNEIMSGVFQKINPSANPKFTKLGLYTIRPLSGLFILLGVLYLVYKFVGILGAGYAVDFLEKIIFIKYVNPFFINVFHFLSLPEIINEAFIGEFGMLTMGLTYAVAIILPIVFTFFIAFSFLEDSGYFPRMGVLLNSVFSFMGLNGKAVLPMVLGLGCDTMATMTTRILNSHKERVIVTLLLALGVPCSAQLGVLMALGAGLPEIYMIAWVFIIIFTLIFVGYLSSKIVKGKPALFLMELPPLRIPQFSNILKKTYMRSKWYLKEAAPLFILGSFILFLFNKFLILNLFNNLLKPLTVYGLGLPAESASSFVMGFLRRDFGAAGFLKLHAEGKMDNLQTLVSLVVITLFIPCVANFLMIIKERGLFTAMGMFLFVIPFSFLVGTVLNHTLRFMFY